MKFLILQMWQLQQSQVASQGMLMGRENLPKSGLHKNGKKVVDVVLDLFGFFFFKFTQSFSAMEDSSPCT